MTNLPLSAHGGCGCQDSAAELPVLDARQIPHAIRHAAILGSIDSLTPGSAMALIAPHDPLPLLTQVRQAQGDRVEIDYLERGPEEWKLRFTRI